MGELEFELYQFIPSYEDRTNLDKIRKHIRGLDFRLENLSGVRQSLNRIEPNDSLVYQCELEIFVNDHPLYELSMGEVRVESAIQNQSISLVNLKLRFEFISFIE